MNLRELFIGFPNFSFSFLFTERARRGGGGPSIHPAIWCWCGFSLLISCGFDLIYTVVKLWLGFWARKLSFVDVYVRTYACNTTRVGCVFSKTPSNSISRRKGKKTLFDFTRLKKRKEKKKAPEEEETHRVVNSTCRLLIDPRRGRGSSIARSFLRNCQIRPGNKFSYCRTDLSITVLFQWVC